MQLLFPQNPMMKKLPDSIFGHEFDAAQSLGFSCLLFAEETLSHLGAEQAVKNLPDGGGEPLLYRGWILTEDVYRQFYHALLARGHRLVSTPEQYAEVTYFPNYYPKVHEVSPEAVWTDTDDPYFAWSQSRKLGEGPFVLKDHIKSAKHLWHEACFVPKGAVREHFESIAQALRDEQGKVFNRGLLSSSMCRCARAVPARANIRCVRRIASSSGKENCWLPRITTIRWRIERIGRSSRRSPDGSMPRFFRWTLRKRRPVVG